MIDQLSRRERQIMNIIYRDGEATVASVRRALADPPSYSAVRALLGVLEKKGFLRHEQRSRAYVYFPTVSRERIGTPVLQQMVQNFFDGSVANVVAALVDHSSGRLTDAELERLERLIRRKRREREGR
jgi:predicted transcriptional regulator